MNTSHAIRAWLETQGGAHTSRQVAEAIGVPAKTVAQTLHKLAEGGMVTADTSYPRLYTFVRHAVPLDVRISMANRARSATAVRTDPEDRKRRNNEANRAYYLRNREALLAKKRVRCKRKYDAAAPERARRAQERAEKRQVAVAQRHVSQELAAQQKRLQALAARAERTSLQTAPKVERIETYEEFIARGGHVERLPGFMERRA